MEGGDRQPLGDGRQPGIPPKAAHQEGRVRRRRRLLQGLLDLRTGQGHQGPLPPKSFFFFFCFWVLVFAFLMVD